MNYRKKAILMVMALFCLNIAILAQAVSLKMDNVSVKEAMTQLKNKSGYSFVYKVGLKVLFGLSKTQKAVICSNSVNQSCLVASDVR